MLKWSCIIKSHPGSRISDITKVAKDFTMQKKEEPEISGSQVITTA